MPVTIYYDDDADLGLIADKKVAILGYGSQGHAHALNLRSSGVDVRVGLREGSSSWAKAEAGGLKAATMADACAEADIIMVLLPDTEQAKAYKEWIEPNLRDGDSLAFAHGFNIHFDQIVPPPGRRRVDDRPQGAGPPRAAHVRGRRRRPRPRRRPPGRHRQGQGNRPGLRQGRSAVPGAASSRRRSGRRPRPTSSASRSSSAAASPSSSRRATRRSSTPATRRSRPTSSASTR